MLSLETETKESSKGESVAMEESSKGESVATKIIQRHYR